nr:chorismate lyase [Advenella kashmirensis]
MSSLMKPEPLSPGWLNRPPPKLDPIQKYWLFRPGPLTQGLRRQGEVRIQVLGEFAEAVSQDERLTIRQEVGTVVWVREICMSIDGTPAVVARSITPLCAARSVWQAVRRLRTRPLADILYHDPAIVRSVFESCIAKSPMPIYKAVIRAGQLPFPAPARLPTRRSVFWKNGQPLQVTECFLPAFWSTLLKHPRA